MIITCPNCSTRYSLPQDKIKPGGQKVRCAKCGNVWYQPPEEPEPLALTPEDAVAPVEAPPTPAWSPSAPGDAAPPEMPVYVPPPPMEASQEPKPLVPPPPGPPPGDNFAQFHQVSPSEDSEGGSGRKWAIAVVVLVIVALGGVVLFKQQIQDLTGIQLVPTAAPAATAPAAAPAVPAAPKPPEPKPLTLKLEDVESSIEEIDGVRKLMVKGLISNPEDREQYVPGLAFDMLNKDGQSIGRWTFDAPVRALAPRTNTRFAAQRDPPPGGLQELNPGFDVPENVPPPSAIPAEAVPGAPVPATSTAPTVTAPAAKPATTP